MVSENSLKELLERYRNIEHEMQLLKKDKHDLLVEFQDKVSPKAFRKALGVARMKAKMKKSEVDEFDAALDILASELGIEDAE